jgi:hypothetical protein
MRKMIIFYFWMKSEWTWSFWSNVQDIYDDPSNTDDLIFLILPGCTGENILIIVFLPDSFLLP